MGEKCGEKMLVKERSRKLSLGMNINKHSNCNGASVVAQRRVDWKQPYSPTALQPYEKGIIHPSHHHPSSSGTLACLGA